MMYLPTKIENLMINKFLIKMNTVQGSLSNVRYKLIGEQFFEFF